MLHFHLMSEFCFNIFLEVLTKGLGCKCKVYASELHCIEGVCTVPDMGRREQGADMSWEQDQKWAAENTNTHKPG